MTDLTPARLREQSAVSDEVGRQWIEYALERPAGSVVGYVARALQAAEAKVEAQQAVVEAARELRKRAGWTISSSRGSAWADLCATLEALDE